MGFFFGTLQTTYLTHLVILFNPYILLQQRSEIMKLQDMIIDKEANKISGQVMLNQSL